MSGSSDQSEERLYETDLMLAAWHGKCEVLEELSQCHVDLKHKEKYAKLIVGKFFRGVRSGVLLCAGYEHLIEDPSCLASLVEIHARFDKIFAIDKHTKLPVSIDIDRPEGKAPSINSDKGRIFVLRELLYFLAMVGVAIGVLKIVSSARRGGSSNRPAGPEDSTARPPASGPGPKTRPEARDVCLIVEEGVLSTNEIPAQAPVEISRDQACELVMAARYFSLMEVGEAEKRESAEGKFQSEEPGSWASGASVDVYLRLRISWQPRENKNEQGYYPVLSSIKAMPGPVRIDRSARMPDRSSGRGWMRRV